ncbi:single-stranded DNA-binding protein [Corynebacterium phocae]|uniref:single-stranded DNA-binding protein n=1 Tax=Corynebacterium phocae TaxID=161895 RepID=UPI0009534697|nr:single-stranded DNA-binding protein [Corynebacterium phocae]
MAHVSLQGNLGKQPELKFSKDGKAYANFSIAWCERQKVQQGWVDGPLIWVQAVAFGKTAEGVCQLDKGMRVNATGRLKAEDWQSNQGPQTVFKLEVESIGPDITFQDVQVRKRERNDQQQGGHAQQPSGQQADPWGGQPASTGGFGGQSAAPPF